MYDYVIVGAGSAGCVLASRLTEDPSVRVLLLEAGGSDARQEIQIPAAFPKLFKSACDWAYVTEPQRELGGRSVFWPRGKVLGGSSSINAMVYSRANASDHNAWGDARIAGWNYCDLLPYYRKSERNERWDNEFHSQDGMWHVSEPRCLSPLTQTFIEAAQAAGIPENVDFNGNTQEGVGYFQVNQKNGRRHSLAAAFLVPARKRGNLAVYSGAHVTRVIFEKQRAVGVEYVREGTRTEAHAERSVLLCGGAVNSPQLLMLSGVGRADHLRAHGVEVIADLPGVGQNLQDHPLMGVEFECGKPISLYKADNLQNILNYLLFKHGPLTSNVCEAAVFTRVDNRSPTPDVEIPFAPTFYMNNGWDNPQLHGYSAGVVVQHPESRGEVALRSNDPFVSPAIQPNYFSEPGDLKVAVAGVKLARELLRSTSFASCRGKEWWPGGDITTDAEIVEHVRRTAQTIYHPVGTCKMAHRDDPLGVVDDKLQVRGVEGLRVVDASVFPFETTGHTNAPVVAVAERAADIIRGVATA